MESARYRQEFRSLLAELPEDRRDAWRPFFEASDAHMSSLQAEVRDARAQSTIDEALREVITGLARVDAREAQTTAALERNTAELGRRVVMPDAKTWGAIVTAVATMVGAIAYALSGGLIGSPLPAAVP